uniref:Uncharacterized protein n=1 Tax=Knipowitschia caucasica TaxID=637954 RepID=A0AAV2JF84_KNICA
MATLREMTSGEPSRDRQCGTSVSVDGSWLGLLARAAGRMHAEAEERSSQLAQDRGRAGAVALSSTDKGSRSKGAAGRHLEGECPPPQLVWPSLAAPQRLSVNSSLIVLFQRLQEDVVTFVKEPCVILRPLTDIWI